MSALAASWRGDGGDDDDDDDELEELLEDIAWLKKPEKDCTDILNQNGCQGANAMWSFLMRNAR